ncbi:MAG: hypothetical protein MK214_08535 [Thalassotalea sp.]|nr:hypothetical protein [Thalassotalea sp.]
MNEIVQTPYSNCQLLKALWRRKVVDVEDFEPLSIKLNNLISPTQQIADFKAMFACTELPVSFLFVVAYRHLGQLLAQAKFSSKLVGLIHLSSHYRVTILPDWSAPYDLRLSLTSCESSPKGLHYIIEVNVYQQSGLCVKCTNEILDKRRDYKRAGSDNETKGELTNDARGDNVAQISDAESAVATNQLSPQLARKYARVSGDYNPIHLSGLLAKLLGMKTSVMQGMYNLHWSLSKVDGSEQATDVMARFNRPCFLPKKVELTINSAGEYSLFSSQRSDRHLHLKLS